MLANKRRTISISKRVDSNKKHDYKRNKQMILEELNKVQKAKRDIIDERELASRNGNYQDPGCIKIDRIILP